MNIPVLISFLAGIFLFELQEEIRTRRAIARHRRMVQAGGDPRRYRELVMSGKPFVWPEDRR